MLHQATDRTQRVAASLYLQPGQLAVFSEPATITTVLGSCVAVCLWDARGRRGGANHFLLPDWTGRHEGSARFANVAVAQLIGTLALMGCRASDLQAKLFGGACVLAALRERRQHLGLQNVETARRLLAEAGIPIVAEDTGGERGRKLLFNTDDGDAYVRLL